jgi:hydroxymethylbilane synthase
MKIRIGTRGSDLALWQANYVKACLEPGAEVEIIVIETRGDAIDDVPLQSVEGKAFFTAEIEKALLDGDIDLAVHSHKDLATSSPGGLVIGAVPERGPVEEVLLIRSESHDLGAPMIPLKAEARVGTSAPRRRAQLLTLRPDLNVADLRGNVPTRVRRCQSGTYDAVILAAAGVQRLDLNTDGLVRVSLPVDIFVPAPAQGALAIQIREEDQELSKLCSSALHHEQTASSVRAERLLLERLGGGCSLPLGVHVHSQAEGFRARAFLGSGCPSEADGARWGDASGTTPLEAADAVCTQLLEGEETEAGPLASVTVALVGSSTDGTSLGERLRELGARVKHESVLGFEDVGAPDLSGKLARLTSGDALAVTSQEAARRLSDVRVPAGVTVAAVGPATARALSAVGLRATYVGKGGAAELARNLPVGEGGRVLFPCAEASRKEMAEGLAQRGVPLEKVVVYRTVQKAAGEHHEGADVRVYMSPSAVTSSVALGRESEQDHLIRVGLGGATCDALQDESLEHHRPSGSGPEAALALIAHLSAKQRKGGA